MSLLSSFQAIEAGIIVNDIATIHNAKRNIECDGYQLPLNVEDVLLNLKIHKRTMKEQMNCVQITLTSDELLDVGDKDDTKTSRVLHVSSNVPMI